MVPHSCTQVRTSVRLYMHLSTSVRVLCSMGSCFSTCFMASPAVRSTRRDLTRFLPGHQAAERNPCLRILGQMRKPATAVASKHALTQDLTLSRSVPRSCCNACKISLNISLSLSYLPRPLHSPTLTSLRYSLLLAPLTGMQEARTSLVSRLRKAAPPAAEKSRLKGLEQV